MESPGVLVVGETPSLGRSIADLLESSGIRTRYVQDLGDEQPLSDLGRRYSVVVAACTGHYCATGRHWARGEVPDVTLVVVGSLDPTLPTIRNVQLVTLPLLPARFLVMIRDLLPAPAGPSPSRPIPP
jgi:hypothetical protein